MRLALLKNTFKRNWVMLVIIFAVLTMYMGFMISMYDPEDMESIMSMLELFPKDLMEAMGFSGVVTNLTGYLASWLYGLLMFGFPLVYSIVLGNRLVAKMVDNRSFAYLLSTPNSRVRIIVTQGIYALSSVALLFAALFGMGVLITSLTFPGLLDIGAFFRLNVTTMLVNMVAMMVSFFFSSLFNETKRSLAFSSGVLITFLLMNMLGNASKDAAFLKGLSIYGWYDPVEVVDGASVLGVNLLYIGIIAVLFTASVLIFKRKRLPL